MNQPSGSIVRPVVLTLAIFVVLTIILEGIDARTAGKQNFETAVGPTVEQADKNIKVLNGMPESQLIPTMKFITVSLGVACTYCHVMKDGQMDAAADDKETKRIARGMMKMVMQANATTFHGAPQISCYTCHRGQAIPQGAPSFPVALKLMPPPGAPPPPSPSATPPLPTTDEVLNKYTNAIGGPAAIEKIKSAVIHGTVANASGSTGTFEADQIAPDKGYDIMTTQRGTRIRVLNLKDQFTKFEVVGTDKIDNHNVDVVKATRPDQKREHLYFDSESGLLLRRVTEMNSKVGIIPEETNFDDYREVESVKLPTTIRLSAIDTQNPTSTRKIDKIELNTPIENFKFEKPQE